MSKVSDDNFWDWKATEVMFHIVKTCETFNADTFFEACRKIDMPPDQISKQVAAKFKRFKAAGYCQSTKEFALSKRNGSSPLPIYRSLHKALHKASLVNNTDDTNSQQNATNQTTAVCLSQVNEGQNTPKEPDKDKLERGA